jgi:1A family penicillin-binding protein
MAEIRNQLRLLFKRRRPFLWPLVGLYLFLLFTGKLELALILQIWRLLRGIFLSSLRLIYLPVVKVRTAAAALISLFPPLRSFPRPKPTLPSFGSISKTRPPIKIGLLRPLALRPPLPRRFSLPPRVDLISFILGLATALLVYSLFLLHHWFAVLPDPTSLTSVNQAATTKIYDRNHVLLYEIYQDVNRSPVTLAEIPPYLRQATIAIEDKDFYSHPGVSLRGMTRAAYKILTRQELQGGSTLTQQLVKTVFFSPRRTIGRKVKEIITALRVEAAFSKDQILEMYLNQVSYGGTAYGVAAAAEQYFGKDVSKLTLAESAFLAGLPAAPTTNSPFGSNPNAYKQRQAAVLRRMVEDGYVSQAEAEEAQNTPLKFAPPKINIKAPHFVMFVREELERRYGRETVAKGGLQVRTSLDLELQKKVQEIVSEEINKVKDLNISNGAALVTKPDTGEILAMVGSRDYFDIENEGQVNVTTSLRQPGSSIKPINYATAFKKGFTPATVLLDVPTTFFVKGQPPYHPVNYDGKFHGAVQLRFALGNSYNVPAVRTLAAVGVKDMMDTAYEMGITSFTDPNRYGLSLTLGGGEVKMTEMAVAFGTFANLGRRQDLVSILEVTDTAGNVIDRFEPQPGPRVLLPEIAYLISHILLDNNARTAAFGPNSLLNIPGHTVSVKTGTTDDVRDNWTIGYTPSFLTAVWVGNNDGHPMNQRLVSGVTGAAPIWNRIMREVLKDQNDEWLPKPDGLVGMQICALSGSLPSNGCQTRFEYFIKGTEPGRGSANILKKAKIFIAKQTGRPAHADDGDVEEREVTLVSDPLTENYCLDCGFYTSRIDVAKIPYLPMRFEVESPKTS